MLSPRTETLWRTAVCGAERPGARFSWWSLRRFCSSAPAVHLALLHLVSWDGSKLRHRPARACLECVCVCACVCVQGHTCACEGGTGGTHLGREKSQVLQAEGSGSDANSRWGPQAVLWRDGQGRRPVRGPSDGLGRRGGLGSQEEQRVCPGDAWEHALVSSPSRPSAVTHLTVNASGPHGCPVESAAHLHSTFEETEAQGG